MVILAISGSLRSASINNILLNAACDMAPQGLTIDVFDGLASLPAFNPDLDDPGVIPPTAAAFRSRVQSAGALLISSPEYAHGIPGSLKNALDWLVGDIHFAGKQVALWNASPRSVHAPAQLQEVLTTMAAVLVEDACLTLPLLGGRPDLATISADERLRASIIAALTALRPAAV